jgi:hypothetical protein
MVISTSKAASIDSFRASFSTVNHFKWNLILKRLV